MAVLDLNLPASGRGRPSKEITISYARDLSERDLVALMTCESGAKPKPLQKLRAAHHNIAILLSQGKGDTEVARITGRSVGNIHLLKRDPAFVNLLNHYAQMGEQALADVYQQLSATGQAALATLQERLEEDPDSFDAKDLVKIVEVAMDRTGHGPTRTIKTLNTADAIKELVEKKKAERAGRVIDVTVA